MNYLAVALALMLPCLTYAQSSHDKAVGWCTTYHVVMGNNERAAEVRALAQDPAAAKAESVKAFKRYLYVSRDTEQMRYHCAQLEAK